MLDGMIRPLIDGYADARLAAIEFEAAVKTLLTAEDRNTVEEYRQGIIRLRQTLEGAEIGGFPFQSITDLFPPSALKNAEGNVLKVQAAVEFLAQAVADLDPDASSLEDYQRVAQELELDVTDLGTKVGDTSVSWLLVAAAVERAREEQAEIDRKLSETNESLLMGPLKNYPRKCRNSAKKSTSWAKRNSWRV
jgi:hypothetical protein